MSVLTEQLELTLACLRNYTKRDQAEEHLIAAMAEAGRLEDELAETKTVLKHQVKCLKHCQAAGEQLRAALDRRRTTGIELIDLLQKETEKNKQLRAELEQVKSLGLDRPHDVSPENCPTFYDGCHCTVDTLVHNIERAEKAEAELARLRWKLVSEGLPENGAVYEVSNGIWIERIWLNGVWCYGDSSPFKNAHQITHYRNRILPGEEDNDE